MAPVLASSFGLPEGEARAHLAEVEILLGGPAANTPWTAATVGHLVVGAACGPGALATGLRCWLHENFNPFNHEKTYLAPGRHPRHPRNRRRPNAQAIAKAT